MYPEYWARAAAILIFFGFNMTFFPQFILGVLGMPRRYHVYPPEFQVWNVLSSAGASILAVAYLLPLFYLGWSLFFGRRAAANPWQATGLEWQTPVAAADAQLRGHARGDARSLPVHAQRRGASAKCLRPQPAMQFADLRQQHDVAQLGMWVFLATEVLFFGGLILAYCVYRFGYPDGFAEAARHTKIVIGTINTAMLLTSSFLVAWAVAIAQAAARASRRHAAVGRGAARDRVPGAQGHRVQDRIRRAPGARAELRVSGDAGARGVVVLRVLFRRHRASRASMSPSVSSRSA